MKLAFLNLTCDTVYKYAAGIPSAVGGAERQQWLLARALAASGWSVSVGVREGLENGVRKRIDGVEFVGIGGGRGHIILAWYCFLSSERPTWLYWRCASHLLGPAVAMAKLLKVRTIFSAAFDSDVTPRYALFERRRWWLLYLCGLFWSDRLILQHAGQFSTLSTKLRAKSHVVPSIGGESVVSRSHGDRAKYVAWVGQLRWHKRPDVLVEVIRKLPDVHFIVCGGPCTVSSPPGYSQSVVDALSNLPNVEYRGQVPPPVALEVIAGAAILLSTSDEEGFPNTFLQAWSCGTPVVSFKIDPDGVIEKEGLGRVVGTIKGAVKNIKTLIECSRQRDEIGHRARKHMEDAHSQEAAVEAFERAIQGVGFCYK